VHRIVAALAHDGLDLTEGALAGVFAACSDLLAPLADKISERNAAGGHLHVDETPLAGCSQRSRAKATTAVVVLGVPRPGHHRVHHRGR
jgi:hypothetical protein